MTGKVPALSKRNLFFIVLGVCLLLLLLWYFMRFQARQLQIQDLNSQIQSSDADLQTLTTQQSRLPALRESVSKLQADQARLTAALPATAKIGQLVSDVRSSVAGAGASITGLNLVPSPETGLPAGVQAMSLTMNLSGKYLQLFNSLRAVEQMGRFAKVTNVNMNLPAPNAVDPQLTGGVTMTIYTFDPSAAAAAAPGAAAAPATGGKS